MGTNSENIPIDVLDPPFILQAPYRDSDFHHEFLTMINSYQTNVSSYYENLRTCLYELRKDGIQMPMDLSGSSHLQTIERLGEINEETEMQTMGVPEASITNMNPELRSSSILHRDSDASHLRPLANMVGFISDVSGLPLSGHVQSTQTMYSGLQPSDTILGASGMIPPTTRRMMTSPRHNVQETETLAHWMNLVYDINRNFRNYSTNISLMFDLYRTILHRNTSLIRNQPGGMRDDEVRGDVWRRSGAPELNSFNDTNRRATEAVLTYTIYPQPTSFNVNDNELLTENEIQQNTEMNIYSTNDEQNTCPISLEQFVAGDSITKIRHCGHTFKTISLFHWFRRSTLCPVCRYNLKQSTVDNIQNAGSNQANPTASTTTASTQNNTFSNTDSLQELISLALNNHTILPSNRNAVRTLSSLLGAIDISLPRM